MIQILIVVVAALMGCTQPANVATDDPTDTTKTAMAAEQGKGPTGPAGSWISSLAPEQPMEVSQTGKALHIHWSATLDMDIEIDGELPEKGANVYGGKVKLVSGDAGAEKAEATLRYDATGQTLTLELPVMWTDTVMFRRVVGTSAGCAAAGEQVVERTQVFKDLTANADGVGIDRETEDPNARVQDYQIFQDSGDMLVTLTRLRVDFTKKQVLAYNVAEDIFEPLDGSAALFEGVSCK